MTGTASDSTDTRGFPCGEVLRGLAWIEWDEQKEANIPQDSKHGLIEIKVIWSCSIRKESKRTCLE